MTTVRGSDWPQYQHDPQHSGRTNVPITPSVLRLAYSTSGTRPLILDNTLYTTRPAGPTTITAYNLADGAVKWTYTNSNFAQAGAASLGSTVAVFGYDYSVQSNVSPADILIETTRALPGIVEGANARLTIPPADAVLYHR